MLAALLEGQHEATNAPALKKDAPVYTLHPFLPPYPQHNTLNLSSHRFKPPTKHESTKKKLHIIKTSLALQITQTQETNATLATCQPEHNLCVWCVCPRGFQMVRFKRKYRKQ